MTANLNMMIPSFTTSLVAFTAYANHVDLAFSIAHYHRLIPALLFSLPFFPFHSANCELLFHPLDPQQPPSTSTNKVTAPPPRLVCIIARATSCQPTTRPTSQDRSIPQQPPYQLATHPPTLLIPIYCNYKDIWAHNWLQMHYQYAKISIETRANTTRPRLHLEFLATATLRHHNPKLQSISSPNKRPYRLPGGKLSFCSPMIKFGSHPLYDLHRSSQRPNSHNPSWDHAMLATVLPSPPPTINCQIGGHVRQIRTM